MPDSLMKSRKSLLELDTVVSLRQAYQEALNRLYNYIEPLMRGRPPGNEEFSDHDVQHSARVLANIERILPDGAVKLTLRDCHEAFIEGSKR